MTGLSTRKSAPPSRCVQWTGPRRPKTPGKVKNREIRMTKRFRKPLFSTTALLLLSGTAAAQVTPGTDTAADTLKGRPYSPYANRAMRPSRLTIAFGQKLTTAFGK